MNRHTAESPTSSLLLLPQVTRRPPFGKNHRCPPAVAEICCLDDSAIQSLDSRLDRALFHKFFIVVEIMNDLPLVVLLPDCVEGFLHLDVVSDVPILFFYKLDAFPEHDRSLLFQFLFCCSIPQLILEELDPEDAIQIELIAQSTFSLDLLNRKIEFLTAGDVSYSLRFPQLFYLCRLLSLLSLRYHYEGDSPFSLIPRVASSQPIPNRKTTDARLKDDLIAHESLLEFLNFKFTSDSAPLDDSIILRLIQSPNDQPSLPQLLTSAPSPCFSALFLLVLLSDRQSDSRPLKGRITVSHGSPAKRLSGIIADMPERADIPHVIPGIDQFCLAGSQKICRDYNSLKLQWTSITARQVLHIPTLIASIRALEISLLRSFPRGHPISHIVFNAMMSFFIMKDEFETFVPEFLDVMVAIAQLFVTRENIGQYDVSEAEHIVFWLFVALVNRTGVTDFLNDPTPDRILQDCLQTILMPHPILSEMIQKDLSSMAGPARIIFSLFAGAMEPKKVWSLWIAAIASGNPMNYCQKVMAMAMIAIFPDIAGTKNLGAAIDAALASFLQRTPVEVIIANTAEIRERFP